MPNRTIYVADVDLPIFEKAQKLAGENLSSTIVQALHRFVEAEEGKTSGFEEITVKVGKGRPYVHKQFQGRLLAKRNLKIQNSSRLLTLTVYQTAKGRFAVHSRNMPNWSGWSHKSHKSGPSRSRTWSGGDWNMDWNVDWSNWDENDWSAYYEDNELRLDVYETLEDLKENIPEDIYTAIVQFLNGGEVEILDI
jgi:EXLDI family protein